VATGPSPLSRWASITVAFGHRSGLGLEIFDLRNQQVSFSAILSMFSRFDRAHRHHHRVAGPSLQATSLLVGEKPCLTLSGWAPSLSNLVDQRPRSALGGAGWLIAFEGSGGERRHRGHHSTATSLTLVPTGRAWR